MSKSSNVSLAIILSVGSFVLLSVLAILIAYYPSSVIIEFMKSPLKFVANKEFGWILLLLLQGTYLILDIVEVATHNINYGIFAGIFMTLLGVLVLGFTIMEGIKEKHLHWHGLIEGLFYFGVGITLIILRKKKKQEEEEEEEEKRKLKEEQEEIDSGL